MNRRTFVAVFSQVLIAIGAFSLGLVTATFTYIRSMDAMLNQTTPTSIRLWVKGVSEAEPSLQSGKSLLKSLVRNQLEDESRKARTYAATLERRGRLDQVGELRKWSDEADALVKRLNPPPANPPENSD